MNCMPRTFPCLRVRDLLALADTVADERVRALAATTD